MGSLSSYSPGEGPACGTHAIPQRACSWKDVLWKCFLYTHRGQHLLLSVAGCCSLACCLPGLFHRCPSFGLDAITHGHPGGIVSWLGWWKTKPTLTSFFNLNSVLRSSWLSVSIGAVSPPSPTSLCLPWVPHPWYLHSARCCQLSRASGPGMEPCGV